MKRELLYVLRQIEQIFISREAEDFYDLTQEDYKEIFQLCETLKDCGFDSEVQTQDDECSFIKHTTYFDEFELEIQLIANECKNIETLEMNFVSFIIYTDEDRVLIYDIIPMIEKVNRD